MPVLGPITPGVPATFAGLSTIIIEEILEDVSLALIEPIVNTTLGTDVTVNGFNSVSPGSMVGIYPGAVLVVGIGMAMEAIVINSVKATSFIANFSFLHSASDPVFSATFPSGQSDHPLFTQGEVISYLADVQNDFLLKTRCIYGVTGTFSEPANIPFVPTTRFYVQPPQAARVERVASLVPGKPSIDLFETTQSDLDLEDFSWTSVTDVPRRWFRDQIDTAKFGLAPMPNVGGSLELWYSKRGPLDTGLTLTSLLLVPDVLAHFIKYGVLAKCWSKDGESRDPMRAQYCQKRFDIGVLLTQRFMEGIGMESKGQPQSFSPIAIPAGA